MSALFEERSGVVPCGTPWGQWYQTLEEVFIEVQVPPGTRAQDIRCDLQSRHMALAVGGREILKVAAGRGLCLPKPPSPWAPVFRRSPVGSPLGSSGQPRERSEWPGCGQTGAPTSGSSPKSTWKFEEPILLALCLNPRKLLFCCPSVGLQLRTA